MSSKPWKFARPFLFHLTFVGFWMLWSLPPLLNNAPLDFQAAGSIIVAYAIYNLSRSRANYEATYRSWIVSRFSSHIERLNQQMLVADQRMNLTADLIFFHLAQACDRLKIQHYWRETDPEVWKKIADEVNSKAGTDNPFPELERAAQTAQSVEAQFHEFEREYLPWLKRVWSLEVWLLILGTLQWGYGDRVVRLIYSQEMASLIEEANAWEFF